MKLLHVVLHVTPKKKETRSNVSKPQEKKPEKPLVVKVQQRDYPPNRTLFIRKLLPHHTHIQLGEQLERFGEIEIIIWNGHYSYVIFKYNNSVDNILRDKNLKLYIAKDLIIHQKFKTRNEMKNEKGKRRHATKI